MRNMAHIIDYVNNEIFLSSVTAIVLIVAHWFVRHFLISEYFSKVFNNDGQCSICLNPQHENNSLPCCGHVFFWLPVSDGGLVSNQIGVSDLQEAIQNV